MRKRLVEYHQMTAPLIGYYTKEAQAGNTKYEMCIRDRVKEGAEGAEPQEEPTIALEQVNQQTLRITMLVMVALFAVMFWAIPHQTETSRK